MPFSDPDFSQAVTLVTGGETPRVWSLIVSLFGDIVEPGGGEISGTLLNRIIGPVGLKPEAIRVALHRLKKDGWIESRKTGRESIYALTEESREETARASLRIYDRKPPAATAFVILTNPETTEFPSGFDGCRISADIAISARQPDNLSDALCFPLTEEEKLPEWMADILQKETGSDRFTTLSARFSRLKSGSDEFGNLSDVQSAALRVLVVHEWRRAVLRHPALPDFVFPGGDRITAARTGFHRLLGLLPRFTVSELQDGPG